MSAARFIPHEEDGVLQGSTLYGIRRGSQLGLLGFQNGDLAVSRALGDFVYKQGKDIKAEAQQVSAEELARLRASLNSFISAAVQP